MNPNNSPDHLSQSVGATGPVHKKQGRNQHELMTRAYEEFLVEINTCNDNDLSESIPAITGQIMLHFEKIYPFISGKIANSLSASV